MPDNKKPPHDASDDLPEDFAEDGEEMIETPLSEAAMAAMLAGAVDEHGEMKR